jgi:hypothetical protein
MKAIVKMPAKSHISSVTLTLKGRNMFHDKPAQPAPRIAVMMI